jgi:hypothetical protein
VILATPFASVGMLGDQSELVRCGASLWVTLEGQQVNTARVQQWRRWAPFGLFLVAPAVGALVDLLVPGPRGHWSGHVGSGAAAAGQLLAVVAGAVLARRRLNGLLVLLLTIVAVGLVLEVIGNQRVAASIWQTSYGDEEAAAIGPSFEGFESGHALAGTGDMLVVLGGLAFALALGALRRVGPGVAVAGVVLSLFPPWILPAVGTVLLLAFLLRGPRQAVRSEAPSVTPTPPGTAAT